MSAVSKPHLSTQPITNTHWTAVERQWVVASSIYILYANILQPPNVLAIPPWISAEGVAGKQSINICILCIMNERLETWVMAAGISYTCLQALNVWGCLCICVHCMRLFCVYMCVCMYMHVCHWEFFLFLVFLFLSLCSVVLYARDLSYKKIDCMGTATIMLEV
jgi:hypothetical protein